MRTITKYETSDGREFTTEADALKHENALTAVNVAMAPLGSRKLANNSGWIQHNPNTVMAVKKALLLLARPIFVGSYPNIVDAIDNDPTGIHPRSVVGRILDDMDSPINDGWHRLMCIDERGREHNQPYFAINGPHSNMVCNEDRR